MASRRSQKKQSRISVSAASQQEDRRLAHKDARSAFIIWAFLEGLSLFILPHSDLIPGHNKLSTWLSFSVPMGMTGAGLIGLSSWLLKYVQEQIDRKHPNKRTMLISSQAVGWVGLIGIGLPSLMVGLTLWSYILKGI